MTGIIYISLIILGIYVCFRQGMILGWVRIAVANKLDRWAGIKWSRYVQKPLWDCLPCMASVWTIVLTWQVNMWQILAVCGLNFLISKAFLDEADS